MPTGTGKSGIMIEDILYRIKNSRNHILINISCPTLKLSQQLTSDLFETLYGILYSNNTLNLTSEQIAFVLNSSDSKFNYNVGNCSVYNDAELESAIISATKSKKVIIIASCHKSLKKFADICKDIRNIEIYNYIDESHLISYNSWYSEPGTGKEILTKLKNNSNGLYLFSATPDFGMTIEITDDSSNPYLYKLYPADAINENLILPPRIRCIRIDKSNIYFEYPDIMKECMKYGGYRKVLITMHNTNELRDLRTFLEKIGYKVFSACSADGFTGTDANDIPKFVEAVDAWNGHCFVLQIRQLIQGADIRTLTDCVIPVTNNMCPKTFRNLIQLMGRVLRVAPGERGVPYNKRTKKAGNIFFMLTPDANPDEELCLRRFALRYYGMECALYGTEFRTPAEMTYEIESTKNKIKEDISLKKEIIELSIKYYGGTPKKEAEKILENIDSYEYYSRYKDSIPEYHLLDNRKLIKYAENIIESL